MVINVKIVCFGFLWKFYEEEVKFLKFREFWLKYIIDIYMIKWIVWCKKNFDYLFVVYDYGIEISCGVFGFEVMIVIGCDFYDFLGV